jgi:hypothetical protein
MQPMSFALLHGAGLAKTPNAHNVRAILGSVEKTPASGAIFAEFGKDLGRYRPQKY